ncbi:MAG: zinc-binding alcohol dehydrogenase family protein [Candidatus Tumulicola sp.]
MKAAVVTAGGAAPQWTDFPDPALVPGEMLVSVSAAALSPLARARASGQHYSATNAATFVAGVDGVGRLQDGRRVYFAFVRTPFGAMAQVAPARADCIVPVPEDVDDVTAAAIANPAMSSWPALCDRAGFQPGESVLINGATGAAGRLAVQIAKHLGAKNVVATGRNAEQLERAAALGADRTIPLEPDDGLDDALHAALVDCDIAIVLDYLWGVSAQRLLAAIARNAAEPAAPRIRFVQIGAVSGSEISLDASVLRGSGVELLGSGLRSVPQARLVSRIGEALAAVVPAKFEVDATARPMVDVQAAWNDDTGGQRLVFVLDSHP